MITPDHRGEGGVWSRPKYDHEILEQPLSYIDALTFSEFVLFTASSCILSIFCLFSLTLKFVQSFSP